MPKGKGAGYYDEYLAAVDSGDKRRVRMCLDKATYLTVEAAERVINVRTRTSGKTLRWYTCPYCGLYHLTSAPLAPTPIAA